MALLDQWCFTFRLDSLKLFDVEHLSVVSLILVSSISKYVKFPNMKDNNNHQNIA